MYSRTLKYSKLCISSFFAPMTLIPGDLGEVSFIWITVAEGFSPLQLEKSRTAHSEAAAYGRDCSHQRTPKSMDQHRHLRLA